MSNQTSRPSWLNRNNYVIYCILCCLIIVGLFYFLDLFHLAWLGGVCCCIIIIIIIAWCLIKKGRISTDFFSCISNSNYDILHDSIPVHMLVAGQTFQTHETFMQKLKLQIELCSAESSNVILVFCPVVSRIGTDMEAAMDRVTVDKPVILVFMHHCHDSSHMTNITVQPSRSNIVQVVHCAFHESTGLLQCQENEQAVTKVEATLKKYK